MKIRISEKSLLEILNAGFKQGIGGIKIKDGEISKISVVSDSWPFTAEYELVIEEGRNGW